MRSVRMWLAAFVSLLFSGCLALPVQAQVTTGGSGLSGIPNLLESVISGAAAESGGALVPVTDAAVGGALVTMGTAAASGLGVASGAALSAAAIGAFGVGAAAACLTVAKDVCGNPIGNGNFTWSGMLGGGTPTNLGPNSALWKYSTIKGAVFVSSSADDVINQGMQNDIQNYYGPNYIFQSCSAATYNAQNTGASAACQAKYKPTGNMVTLTGTALKDSAHTVPAGGLNCGTDVFQVPSGSSGPLDCSEAVPGTGNVKNAANLSPSDFSQSQLNEQANPEFIANMANQVNNQMGQSGGGGGGGGGGVAPVSHPITGQQVQMVENQTGNFPTLADLLTPEQAVTVTNGTTTTSLNAGQSPTVQTTAPQTIPPSTAAQQASAPCGNLLAGEPDCSTTLDMTFNPETGCWEYMGATALARTTDGCTQTPGNNKDGKNLGPLQDLTTQLLKQALQSDTASKTATVNTPNINVTTSPQVAVTQAQKTMDQTLTKSQESLTNKYPTPNQPTITLPFDAWPQVFQNFNTNVPNISGQCPKVSFTVATLRNTTFTFATQCLVMDSLKPYMQYVLPPTYLFMGLLFLMAA